MAETSPTPVEFEERETEELVELVENGEEFSEERGEGMAN